MYLRNLRTIEKHLELHPDDARALYFGASSLAELGERDRAFEWIHRAIAVDPDDPGVLYNVACAYSVMGEVDEAISCLERAVRNGFGHKEWLANDGDLNALRNTPRFQALLASL